MGGEGDAGVNNAMTSPMARGSPAFDAHHQLTGRRYTMKYQQGQYIAQFKKECKYLPIENSARQLLGSHVSRYINDRAIY